MFSLLLILTDINVLCFEAVCSYNNRDYGISHEIGINSRMTQFIPFMFRSIFDL